ncbi:MAG TPA: proline racemase family protein [Geminicoccaceae bacterium]|nr:proline racemase family protein [Geminicoccaceae bacterium]
MHGVDRITTVEMHTGGEPVRIVTGGYPPLEGRTLLEKRRFARDRLDHLRRMLMAEPRGHADMYGALLVEPDLEEADLAVLFLHNEGYSTMCGHAVVALGRYAVDRGLVTARAPETVVRIQCPCGLVTVTVQVRDGRAGGARFQSVPAFAHARDAVVATQEYGPVTLDVGYGGAFYGILRAATLGLDLERDSLARLVDAAMRVKAAAAAQLSLTHPTEPELAFLYGIMLTDGADEYSPRSTLNICVFADGQVDRSPTGSGVTARLALMHRRGQVGVGQSRSFRSITGAEFVGRVVATAAAGPHPAVIVEVAGEAFYIGEATFAREPEDPLGAGFLLRR